MNQPQVAFYNRKGPNYAIIGPLLVNTGLGEMPQVECPVVDVTDVVDGSAVAKVADVYIDPNGVSDVEAMLVDLVAIEGVKVERNGHAH
jgi:hypothetical protein